MPAGSTKKKKKRFIIKVRAGDGASHCQRSSSHMLLWQKRRGPTVDVFTALSLVREASLKRSGFDESVDIALQLGIDPRKPDQGVRGVVQLPHGTGKEVVVAVFAEGAAAEEARAAGAQVVGGEDLVEEILEGRLDFTKAIASPDMMRYIGRAARILGPRGLMPNPKLGTVTPAVGDAVRAALRGQCEFRAEKRGIVHAGFGRVSFSEDALAENLRSFMVAVSNLKPEGAKGQYLRHATISSTMGKGYSIDMAFLDPSSRWFMRRPLTGQEGED